MDDYIHGYSQKEIDRLYEQAEILEDLLHYDTHYPIESQVLEAGCGVGAQTAILARRNPGINLVSIDRAEEFLHHAKENITNEWISNVHFIHGDITKLPFEDKSFDHVFVSFVLEHLSNPDKILDEIYRVLRKDGTLTIIEGDHGSCFWHPETEESIAVWESFIQVQQDLGHDPLIGRKLYPLLLHAGFDEIKIEPRYVYTDGSDKKMADNVLSKIIAPMTETAKEVAIKNKYVDKETWEKGINDFEKIGDSSKATFFYSWFKAVAVK
jgi:ubiquinone/menaquinone biosynthesis C-methylase UbiE